MRDNTVVTLGDYESIMYPSPTYSKRGLVFQNRAQQGRKNAAHGAGWGKAGNRQVQAEARNRQYRVVCNIRFWPRLRYFFSAFFSAACFCAATVQGGTIPFTRA